MTVVVRQPVDGSTLRGVRKRTREDVDSTGRVVSSHEQLPVWRRVNVCVSSREQITDRASPYTTLVTRKLAELIRALCTGFRGASLQFPFTTTKADRATRQLVALAIKTEEL
jgi:hypothetical protein